MYIVHVQKDQIVSQVTSGQMKYARFQELGVLNFPICSANHRTAIDNLSTVLFL
jgi:hypothetical protein